MNQQRIDRRRGIGLVFAAALLWSTGGIGIKAIDDPALKVACLRSAIAAVALFALFRPRFVRFTPGFILSVISYAACLTTFVMATKWTTAANAIFLQYSGVIWVLLLSPWLLKEPLTARDTVAITVALGGMALFFVEDFDTRGVTGNVMAVVSSLFFAALIISLRKQRGVASEAAVTYGNVLAALALLPFVAGDLSLTPKSVGILLYLGVFQIAVAYGLFVRGLSYVTATQASLTGMIEPVANPLWVFLLLGERPSSYAITGGAIVLAAICWRTLTRGEPAAAPIPPPD